jgi:hypothetical protein
MAEPGQHDPELSFTQTDAEPKPWLPIAIAGAVILVAVGLLIAFAGHRTAPALMGPGLAPTDPYAPSLAIANVHMSEASNFAGGKVIYLDGDIINKGDKTVTAITVQVAFFNDLKEIAQKDSLPLNLIRTHEPYVDTQPVSVAPLRPGDQREFRLIFDSVPGDWNQQYPELRIIQVVAR